MADFQENRCPVRATIKALSGKWKVGIVWHLSLGTRGFAELRRLLRGISEKVLAQQLRQLEAAKIVTRAIRPTTPPRVDYSLTPAGERLIPMLEQLCAWGSLHFGIEPSLKRPAELKRSAGRIR